MLTHIHIENFTLVKSLSIDFTSGFSVLTGETGAGKSIWVDAVGIALGNRADSTLIRHNENRCTITLCFDLTHLPEAQQWLKENDFDDEECIVRRTLVREGQSRITLNGQPCSASIMRAFAQHVLHIHSQHEHQTLMQSDAQRHCIDAFGQHQPELQTLQKIYQKWKTVQHELDCLLAQTQSRDAELELLHYQHDELAKLNLVEGEWKTLSDQHEKMHQAKSLITHLTEALDLTIDNESNNARDLCQQALGQLKAIHIQDPHLQSIVDLLENAFIHLQEAGQALSLYRHHLDLSPENLDKIDQRLTLLYDLARKHHVAPETLKSVEKSLEQKIHTLENIDVHINTLTQTKTLLENQYQKAAQILSEKRQRIADTLNQAVTEQIQQLGMAGGEFKIILTPCTQTLNPLGAERIAFHVSTNPGQPLAPMHKVVSGGELSRISLALQVITAQKHGTPTLIFDEVDTGIGGQTAQTVGKLLRKLGEYSQILCITHLPQVAAQGHHQYQARKSHVAQDTTTQIEKLDEAGRIDELARMLGGQTITAKTRAHAAQLLKS